MHGKELSIGELEWIAGNDNAEKHDRALARTALSWAHEKKGTYMYTTLDLFEATSVDQWRIAINDETQGTWGALGLYLEKYGAGMAEYGDEEETAEQALFLSRIAFERGGGRIAAMGTLAGPCQYRAF